MFALACQWQRGAYPTLTAGIDTIGNIIIPSAPILRPLFIVSYSEPQELRLRSMRLFPGNGSRALALARHGGYLDE